MKAHEEFLDWEGLAAQLDVLRAAVEGGDVPAIKAVLKACVQGYVEPAGTDS